MKTSEVLKHAKHHLAKNQLDTCTHTEKFICIAIKFAAFHTKRITEADVERCKHMIMSRLEGSATLQVWLASKGCLPSDPLTIADKDRIQQHRHAWLDMLVAEFEAKGD